VGPVRRPIVPPGLSPRSLGTARPEHDDDDDEGDEGDDALIEMSEHYHYDDSAHAQTCDAEERKWRPVEEFVSVGALYSVLTPS
jgi:hypothetical protein